MPTAQLSINGKTFTFVVGETGITNIFAGDKGELVVVHNGHIERYYNTPFSVSQPRKEKAANIDA